jgi:hypothetical protein
VTSTRGGRKTTLQEVAASDEPGALGAAALIEAGYAGHTRLAELDAGSVVRTSDDAVGYPPARIQVPRVVAWAN